MAYERLPRGTLLENVTYSNRVAHTDNWCRCPECSDRFRAGDPVVLVRWGTEKDEWGLLIPEHFKRSFGLNGGRPARPPEDPHVAQRSVWYERLPDGNRHRNKHYVVKVDADDNEVYFTGIRERAIGAVEFAVAHLGYLDESDDAQDRRDP